MSISLKEMEIQLSDISIYREAKEEMDTGPSLEDVIVSMQQHLRCAGEENIGDVVYQRSRGNGAAPAAAGGVTSTPRAAAGGVTHTPQLSQTVYTAPWTYANNTDGIYGDDDASECDEAPLPVLTREILRRHINAKAESEYAEVANDQGQEVSFLEDEHIRRMLDEERDGDDGDEFLNPVAHPRLSTPFYQQLRVKYPQAFQRRSSVTSMTSELSSICPHDSPNGCSPENGLSTRPPLPPCSRKGVNFCVEGFRSDGEDISIVGTSPRSNHSLSFERDCIPTSLQGILKKDSPLSSYHSATNDTSERSLLTLKERLKRNRETFRHLMCDENSPFGRRKKSCSQSSLPKDKMDVSAALMSSNGMQNVCIDEHVSKRSLTPGSSRKHVRTKRFASPDSTHDSAVDMDSASMLSMQLDTQLPNGLCLCLPKAQEQNNNACKTSSLKLRCRQKLGADHSSDWPLSGKPPTGLIMANYGKDSDDDSGIAYGCQSEPHIADYKHGDEPIDCRTGDVEMRPLHDYPSRHTRTTREDHSTAAISTMDGQLDQSMGKQKDLHVKSFDDVDGYHDGEIDPVERTIPSSGRSSSLTQKHREVTFEDEIHRQSLHRACSQPLLNCSSDLPSGGRTLHRVLHLDGGIEDAESCGRNIVDELHRYHSEDDLMENYMRHSHRRRMHHGHISRRKCSSPTAGVDTIESSMEVHRASPAVVLSVSTNEHVRNKPPRPPGSKTRQHRFHSRMSPDNSGYSSERAKHTLSDTELDCEVMRANEFITNGHGLASTQSDRKRFHFPWRKNRGRYTPSEEIIKIEKSHGQNASLSSLTSSDISSSGQRIAQGASKLRNGQRQVTKSHVCEMVSESEANYERVREFSRSVDSVNSFCSDNTSSVSPESDYENVDSIKKTNKQSSKPPTGRSRSQNRHISTTSDGNYEVVMNGSRFVTTMESNGRGRSTSHIESDYETVDAITKPNKQHYDRHDNRGSLRGPMKYQVNGNTSAQQDRSHAVYAEVDFSRKTRKNTSCATTEWDESISTLPLPPVPFRGYESDLQRHRGLSGSRSSLADKVGGFRRSVKRKFSRLRRAVSLERLEKTEGPVGEPTVGMAGGRWKSPSLTSLTAVFKKKKNRDGERPGSKQLSRDARRQSSSMTALNDTQPPKKCQPIGMLQKINLDGTQIIHLLKPADGPFGFYIARGSAKYNHAVFVSRLCDSLPANFFAGLLNIGDEIIEINGTPMKKLSLEETYDLMARQDELRLKILPFMARRDV